MFPTLMIGVFLVAQGAVTGMDAATAAGLEPRPPAARLSPIQARVDTAEAGATIEVGAGTYRGDLFLDRPVHLVGRGRPLLVGSGRGSVVIVRAAGVTIEGFDIDGEMGGSLAADSSGVHISVPRATVRDVRITRTFFGIYLREADGAVIERNEIQGVPDLPPGEQGSGLHVYNTQGFSLLQNRIRDVRDGVYIQSSNGGTVRGNDAARLRYGLHYMFSDDNVFEDNRFENGAAGAALMYSKRLIFRRNRFLHNRGFASVGLLLKDCEDLVAEDNFIGDNARGLFLEGSHRNTFRRNIVALSDTAIILFDSSHDNVFEGNAFVANQSPLELVGRRSDTRFDGNYWAEADEPDLNGDGVRDRPFPLANVFDHFRGNLTAAELFAQSPGARALGAAERAFPVLRPTTVQDRHPLVRPPSLTDVPVTASAHVVNLTGLVSALALLLSGLQIVAWGRKRKAVVTR